MTERVKTTYSYDSMYRMASAAVTTNTGLAMSAVYTYNNDLLASIQTASTTYDFTYGDFGLRTSVDIGERNLATYHYNDEISNGGEDDYRNDLDRLDYGNGDSVEYEYDGLGRVTKQTYEDGDTVTYRYDNSGALATVKDSATGRKTTYYYDLTDRMVKYVESGTDYEHSVGYEYNADNNLTSLVETINGTDYTTSYTYDDDNRVTSMTTDGTTVAYTYDAYGRVSTQVTKRGSTTILTETYTYTANSSQIATYKTEAANYSITYTYTYDYNGNILSVSDGTYLTSYAYDSANQLLRENNQRRGRTYTWTYDAADNIQSYKIYAHTTGAINENTLITNNAYTYSDGAWGDQLIAYNGETIDYDEIGNADGYNGWTFTWEHGTQMASQAKNGVTWNHTYDANGMRTKRSNGSTTYEYIYSGDMLTQMIITDHTSEPDLSQIVDFSYDSSGMPLTMTYNGQTYYYVVNSQGDVTGLVNEDGDLKLSYTYEAFGAEYISTSSDAAELAAINPLTYRGYVQDVETGMYYLQTRYYDPTLCRFFNRDTTGVLEMSAGAPNWDKNLYAYCDNNPVNREDIDGQGWHILIAAAASGTTALITSLVTEAIDPEIEGGPRGLKGYELLNVFVATTCASGDGALSAMFPDWSPLISGVSAALEYVVTDIINDNLGSSPQKSSWGERLINAANSGGLSAATAAMGGDEIKRGAQMIDEVIDYTGKATTKGIHPRVKQKAAQMAKTIAKKVKPLFVEGSIGDQISSFALKFLGDWMEIN